MGKWWWKVQWVDNIIRKASCIQNILTCNKQLQCVVCQIHSSFSSEDFITNLVTNDIKGGRILSKLTTKINKDKEKIKTRILEHLTSKFMEYGLSFTAHLSLLSLLCYALAQARTRPVIAVHLRFKMLNNILFLHFRNFYFALIHWWPIWVPDFNFFPDFQFYSQKESRNNCK